MAPRNYFPWRSCDFCGRRNTPTWETRYERRGWTLHFHSFKLACPGCAAKGREAEQRTIRAIFKADRIRAEDRRSVVSEPYHDTPLPRTHRIRLRGSQEVIDVHLEDKCFYALDGTWHVPVNDGRVARVLKRYPTHEDDAPARASDPHPVTVQPPAQPLYGLAVDN